MPKDNPENYERTIEESIIETVREPLIVLDSDLRVISASKSFYRSFKVNPKETQGRLIYDLGNRQWNIPKLRKLLEEILPRDTTIENYEVEHEFPRIGRRIMLLNARRILRSPAEPQIILLAIEDITERKEEEEETLRKSEERYREIANSITDIFFAMDKDLRYIFWNKASEKLTGIKAKDAIGKSIFEIFPDNEDTRRAVAVYREVLKTKKPHVSINKYQLRGKNYFFEISAYPSKDGLSVFTKDITERKKVEEKLNKSKKELEAKISDFERFSKLSVGRELRMIELKKRVKELEKELKEKSK